jgi:hypothetical protein
MVDYGTLSIVLTGIGIIVAISYYTLTLRNANRTRQAQILMQLYDRWVEVEFKQLQREVSEMSWVDYDDYKRKYGPQSNPEADDKQRSLAAYYEGIGVLVNRKLIEASMVDDLMSNAIINYWEKWAPVLREIRREYNYPQAAEWVEYLYSVIKPIAEKQHPELKT